jgi:ElaB/YqjD/DUF883 family membrane-anchored ribosome-binding protein
METKELRSKKEITRDIEETRAQVKTALQQTKRATKGPNAAKRAWLKTKDAAVKTKDSVKEAKAAAIRKTRAADCAIRGNIYSSIGAAAAVGLAAGFIVRKKRKTQRCD